MAPVRRDPPLDAEDDCVLDDLRTAVRVSDSNVERFGLYGDLGLAIKEQEVIQKLLGGRQEKLVLNVADVLVAERAYKRVDEVCSGVGFGQLQVARGPMEVLDGL